MKKKRFIFTTLLILLVGTLLTSCGPEDSGFSSENTASSDYVAEMLVTEEEGSSIGSGVIWLGISGVLAFFASFGLEKDSSFREPRDWKVIVVKFLATFVIVFSASFVYASYVTIQPGHVGVVVNQGRADSEPIYSGQHWITGYLERVVVYPTREFTFSLLTDPINQGSEQYRTYTMGFVSSDGVDGIIKFQAQASLNPALAVSVYENYGTLENLIVQSIKTPSLSLVRDVLRGRTAEDVITTIDSLNPVVEKLLLPIMEKNGLILVSFSFRQPDFGVWQETRNATQVAVQDALRAEQQALVVEKDQQARIFTAEADASILALDARAQADAAIIVAEGQAQVIKVEADAQAYATLATAGAEAEANTVLSESLTDTLISYKRWLLWDGGLPTTILGGGEDLLYSLP